MNFFYTKVPILADKNVQAFYFWRPANSNKQTIVILPGLDESIMDYQAFLKELCQQLPHYSILAIDLRGQGKTLEGEGAVSSEMIMLDQQVAIVRQIVEELQISSLFVVGLSYGGAVALSCANRLNQIEGLALLAPYVSKFKTYDGGLSGLWYSIMSLNPFYKSMSKFSLPYYFQILHDTGKLNPNINWSDKKLDALTKLTLGVEEISTNEEAQKLKNLKYGVHFLIGEKDPLVSVNAVEHLFNEIKGKDKSLQVMPNLGHRLLSNNYDLCTKWLLTLFKEMI